MKRAKVFLGAALSIIFLFVTMLSAQVPQLINYQGVLHDPNTGIPISQDKSIFFAIYATATGGTALWSETQTVSIDKGYFSVLLGSVTPIPNTVFSGDGRYLGVKVENDPEMTPRKSIVSVGYAFRAYEADKVDGQELSSNDGAVNESSDPVSWSKIKDIPAGFADGTDDVDTAGGISQVNVGTGMTVTNPTGPTTTLGLRMGHGNGIDADLLDGQHAGNFAAFSHNHLGEHWTGSYAWANAGLKVTNLSSGPGVYGINRGGGNGVRGQTNGTGIGVYGQCDDSGPGVVGRSSTGDGVKGFGSASGVYGEASGNGGQGVYGKGTGTLTEGVVGVATGGGIGVHGMATSAAGVRGESQSGDGVAGKTSNSTKSGVYGHSTDGFGMTGRSTKSNGVQGFSTNGYGVYGYSTSSYGVHGHTGSSGEGTTSGYLGGNEGVRGEYPFRGTWGTLGSWYNGVAGHSINNSDIGVYATAEYGTGVYGYSKYGYAGKFSGKVRVTGYLEKAGGGFKIDHPIDPANKYLNHSFVESPDMMNVYNGNVTLDANGEAVVELPAWFEALNKDFRYQLTCIGGFAPVYIAEEISGNRFRIAGGSPGVKVSWQVTGLRQDDWANAHRVPVEEEKPVANRGKYLHPEEHGMPENLGIEYETVHRVKAEIK